MIKVENKQEDRQVEPVDFGDDVLDFTFPKSSRLIQGYRRAAALPKEEQAIVAVQFQYEWLEKGFGEENWAYIQDRLDDEDDWLDSNHIDFVFESLMELIAQRPTTSRRNSSRPPRQSKRTAKPSPKAPVSETSE